MQHLFQIRYQTTKYYFSKNIYTTTTTTTTINNNSINSNIKFYSSRTSTTSNNINNSFNNYNTSNKFNKLYKEMTMNGTTELKPIIAPSLLSGDFAFLARDANYMLEQGAEWLHMDVMDNHFVPNLTIGAPVIKSLRKHTKGYLDCHLMVTDPMSMIEDFKNAGADGITFHIEATEHADGTSQTKEVIEKIKAGGMKCGISLKPKTPVESIFKYIELIDFVLIMTVEPGFGGQSFMNDMMPKVETLRKKYPHLPIQVDGGLDPKTIDAAAKAGANIIVAGSSLFKPGQVPSETMQLFRDTINKHRVNW